MPKPRGHNPSVYIIICSRRIRVMLADMPTKPSSLVKVMEASDCAAQVVSQLELLHPNDPIDAGEVTDLQHSMMDGLFNMSATEAEAKVAQMFVLLSALEDSVGEHEY